MRSACWQCGTALLEGHADICPSCVLDSALADEVDDHGAAGESSASEDAETRLAPAHPLPAHPLPAHPLPAHPLPAHALQAGSRIGPYTVVGKLGRGGMGEVYEATHERLQRTVAVKALPPEMSSSATRRQRFLREARATSALDHRHIVTVHDLITEDERDYIVMELVRGRTLADVLRDGALPVAETLRCGLQITDALATAHAAGIVHRDLKPSNVMLNERGEVKLLDFGLAKQVAAEEGEVRTATELTRLGTVMGSAPYMSPEQARGEVVGPETDLFSLGTLLYEMLAGQLPFQSEDRVKLLHEVCYLEPTPIGELRPDAPEELATLVMGLLRKEPRKRLRPMATVRSILAELQAPSATGVSAASHASLSSAARSFAADLDASRPATTPPPVNRRRREGLWAAAILFLTALGAGVYLSSRDGRETVESRALPAASTLPAAEERTAYEWSEQGFELLARYDREGNVDDAVASFQRALQRNADFARAYSGLGRAYYFQYLGNDDPAGLDRAIENARQGVVLNPDLGEAHAVFGAAVSRRDEAAGLASLEDAVQLDPDSDLAHSELGLFYLRRQQFEAAEQELRRALELRPEDWRHHHQLGSLLYEIGRYEEAETELREASRLSPGNHIPFRDLAAVHQKQGDYAAAASSLQEALKHRPIAVVYSHLGSIYYFQGLYPKAADAFERAVELGPSYYLNWANLGDGYRRLVDHGPEAADAFERALQLLENELAMNPEDATLRSRRAVFLAKAGRTEAALELAAADGLATSDNPNVHYRLGLATEIAGDREAALQHLERALRLGYSRDEVEREPELAALRQDVRFHRILGELAATRAEG